MVRILTVTACSLVVLATAVAQDSAAVEVGKAAPDFTMTGIDGTDFKLSDVTATGKNVVLMFDRANW